MRAGSPRYDLCCTDHLDHVGDLGDHAADLRVVVENGGAADAVEAQAHESGALILLAADGARGLANGDLVHGLESLSFGDVAGAVGAAADDVADLLAALGGHLAGRSLDLEGLEGGADHVVGIGRTHRLGDHVLHAQGLEDRAHRAAGDDAGAGRGGAHHDLAGPPAALAVVVQGAGFAQRHADHGLLGFLGGLADGLGHFARLAVAETDPALLIADQHQGGEGETPAALHRGRDAVDVHQLFDDVAIAALLGFVPVASPAVTAAALLFATSHA